MVKPSSKRKQRTSHPSVLKRFSLPEVIMPGVPYLELQGDSALTVTGYESLLLYEDNNILFRMKDPLGTHFSLLRVTGSDLTISVIRDGVLSVCGRIDAVILHPKDVGSA